MKTIETIEQAGPDKVLRLNIPVDEPDSPDHVVVIVKPAKGRRSDGTKGGWPPGFIEATAGAWLGEPPYG